MAAVDAATVDSPGQPARDPAAAAGVDSPRQCSRDSPAAHALAVEVEFAGEEVEPAAHPAVRVRVGEDRGAAGRATAMRCRTRARRSGSSWFDRQPGLARRAEDVAAVEVLVTDDGLLLRRTQLPVGSHCGVEERGARRLAEGSPARGELLHPAFRHVHQQTEWVRLGGGGRQMLVRTRAAAVFASSSSVTPESWLPGSQRSSSSAERSSSSSSRRTAPRPCQSPSAVASCSVSRSGKLTLRTAGDPSARSALSASPTLPPLYGSPRRRPQASAHAWTIHGRRSSQSRPSGTSRHLSSTVGMRRVSALLGRVQAWVIIAGRLPRDDHSASSEISQDECLPASPSLPARARMAGTRAARRPARRRGHGSGLAGAARPSVNRERRALNVELDVGDMQRSRARQQRRHVRARARPAERPSEADLASENLLMRAVILEHDDGIVPVVRQPITLCDSDFVHLRLTDPSSRQRPRLKTRVSRIDSEPPGAVKNRRLALDRFPMEPLSKVPRRSESRQSSLRNQRTMSFGSSPSNSS